LGGISWAQTTVTPLGEKFDTNEVIFSVTMSPATPTWVFVEYTSPPHHPASMSRATFTSVSAGTLAAGDQGFWLAGNATVTAKLNGVSGKFSWCAYAINVPPNAEVEANGGYTLRGTPPFLINGNIPVYDYNFGPGTCITSITDLTYNPAGFLHTPPMTVTATAPATVCAGAPLTFTAIATGGTTTAMSYTWSITRAGNTTSATTHTNAYITALATTGAEAYTPYTYTVYATNANGCTSTVSPAGSVTVYAVPVVQKVSSATICFGATAALSATASNVTTPATYTWNIQGQSQTPTTTSTYTTPGLTATATYTVQITNATGCASTVSGAGTITVYDDLNPGTITSSTTAVCKDGTVSAFTATAPSGGNGTYTYQWMQGSGNATGMSTASSFTPAGTYLSAPGTYHFTRVVTSCTSGTTTGTYTLVVHDLPGAPTNASNNTRCGTGDVTFSATTATGCTIDWYTASSGGSTVSVGTPAYTRSLTAPTAATYYAQSRNTSTGCVSASRLAVTGLAYAIPSVTTTNAEAICQTGAVTLTATAIGSPTTANTYTWIVGASQATTTTNGTYSTTVQPGSTTFHVSVTIEGGCTSGGTQGTAHRCALILNIPGYGVIELAQGNAPYDIAGADWYESTAHCAEKGFRLPTLVEAQHLFTYRALVPGGVGAIWAWTSTMCVAAEDWICIVGCQDGVLEESRKSTTGYRGARCVK
jgi:hypothetical protein